MSWKCSPPIDTSPAVAGVRPTITRMVVVLPAPLGPRKPVTVPGLQTKLMSSTATKLPYFRVSPSTLIMRAILPTASDAGHRTPASAGATKVGVAPPTPDRC